jgi:hypothetical protein
MIGEVTARLGRSVDFVRRLTDEGQLRAEPRGIIARDARGHHARRDG